MAMENEDNQRQPPRYFVNPIFRAQQNILYAHNHTYVPQTYNSRYIAGEECLL